MDGEEVSWGRGSMSLCCTGWDPQYLPALQKALGVGADGVLGKLNMALDSLHSVTNLSLELERGTWVLTRGKLFMRRVDFFSSRARGWGGDGGLMPWLSGRGTVSPPLWDCIRGSSLSTLLGTFLAQYI